MWPLFVDWICKGLMFAPDVEGICCCVLEGVIKSDDAFDKYDTNFLICTLRTFYVIFKFSA